jgi:PRTRC genetic system protein A
MDLITNVMNLAFEAEQQGPGLVGYILNRERAYDPPECRGQMFDYILAANGLFLHAKREKLEVCFPIAPASVRGLEECFDNVSGQFLPVPVNIVEEILYISRRYAEDSKETLFWLEHSELYPHDNGWLIRQPEQTRAIGSCRPTEGQDEAYSRALVDVHSHHRMKARFSSTDDADESGFRLYCVIGSLLHQPEIRLRVGCYGYFWEIPASWVFDLPAGLLDCNPETGESEEEVE